MQVTVVNMCREKETVCYDGPGIKSPVLQFIYNQSEWECLSSTFQMLCKISRRDNACANAPHLLYHTMRARDDQVTNLVRINVNQNWMLPVQMYDHDAYSSGTTKYIYFHHAHITSGLEISGRNVSHPYMLYEGVSCLYGGIYIVQTLSSMESEIVSLCEPVDDSAQSSISIDDLRNVSVVIIHYSAYSTDRITFHYKYRWVNSYSVLKQTYMTMEDETLRITVPTLSNNITEIASIAIHSYQVNLRKVQYINITLENKDVIKLQCFVSYEDYEHSCYYITLFYSTHPSNIIGRQYDVETVDLHSLKSITRHDFIQSIFIDTSTCSLFDFTSWTLEIIKYEQTYHYTMNTTYYTFLPSAVLKQHYKLGFYSMRTTMLTLVHVWVMVHMVRPKDVPPYAIWRVWLEISDTCNTISPVSLEILFDKHHSSSIYGWNHLNKSDDVYMTVDKAVNILFKSACSVYYVQELISVWFLRHFIYDDRAAKYIAGQTPQESFFTSHSQR